VGDGISTGAYFQESKTVNDNRVLSQVHVVMQQDSDLYLQAFSDILYHRTLKLESTDPTVFCLIAVSRRLDKPVSHMALNIP